MRLGRVLGHVRDLNRDITGEMTLGTFFLILLMVLTGAAWLFINYMLWFILLPTVFRRLLDQLRRHRDQQNST